METAAPAPTKANGTKSGRQAVAADAATAQGRKASKASVTKSATSAAGKATAPAVRPASIDDGAKVDEADGQADDGDDDSMDEREAEAATAAPVRPYQRKQKTLLLSSRGITTRYRHLFKDLHKLMPHCRKGTFLAHPENKLDSKSQLYVINEIADMYNCNNCIFFETRKRRDLFMWFSKAPQGPSMKCYVQNVHTMQELNMTGNSLKGARPLLSFDATFESSPHWLLVKEMLTQILGTPKGHPKSKPFIDHVFSFSIADNKIWFRNHQITTLVNDRGVRETKLVEIGPRFVMTVIRIFGGSFGGPTLFQNDAYISPNEIRRSLKAKDSGKYSHRVDALAARNQRLEANQLPEDELEDAFEE